MPPAPTGSRWADDSSPVRPGEELDAERLSAYLREHLELDGPLVVEQFPKGFSNLTYLLRLGDRQWVLRRPPFGARIQTAHDMGREHRILSRLCEVYPKAPRPLLYCEDPDVLGAPFYVMERVRGVILRPRMPAEMAPAPELMAAIAGSLVDTFVELHAVDYRAAGLGDLGHPEGYVERQIEGWAKRYRNAATDDVPEMERLVAWLTDHMPEKSAGPPQAAALIHNDFKYDNLVLDADDWSRVIAVLDWEMATLGDPLMDLGTSLAYWVDPDDPPELQGLQLSPTNLPGNPRRAEVAHLYAERSGRDLRHLVFYYVYGLYKLAVVVQQIYARYQSGHTRDPRFAALIHAVRGCAVVASQAVAKNRIDRLFE